MSAQANFFKIGLFVIGATIALVFLLVMLGAGRIFQSKILMETYFNESVQGLEVGSKVKYRGVIVGEVKSIGFTYTTLSAGHPDVRSPALRHGSGDDIAATDRRSRQCRATSRAARRSRPRSKRDCACGSRRRASPEQSISRSTMSIRKPIRFCRFLGRPRTSTFPSAQSTVTQFVAAASDIVEHLRNVDLEATIANLNGCW